MAPAFLYDLSSLDLNKVIITPEDVRKVLPHRYEMEMITGIILDDDQYIIGFKEITTEDFWVRGHIPGRPLMPGVLMIECAAQICAFYTMRKQPEMGFVGFARCDDVVFRGTVTPPGRLYMVCETIEITRRRAKARCQGIYNGNLVFEATVTGMSV